MKAILLSAILIFISCGKLFPQEFLLPQKFLFTGDLNKYKLKTTERTDQSSTAGTGNSIILGSILVLTPTLVIEDKKAYFGLSKELSLGKYPFGRAELDYTYIFRSERTSAVHISYNLDIPFNGNFRHPSLFMFSPGGGYYTDFTNKGYFVQLAVGLWAGTGFSNAISIHPNLKFRKVFMQDDRPGSFEVSLGVGFGFYTR